MFRWCSAAFPGESPRIGKVSEFRNRKQTFEEALTSADSALTRPDTAAAPEREDDESLSESLAPSRFYLFRVCASDHLCTLLHTCFPHRLKRFSSQHLKRRSGNRTWPKSSISMKMKMAVRSFHRPHLRSIRGQRGRGKGTWLRKTLTRVMEMNRHRIIGTLHDWCCSLLLCVCVQVGVFSLSLPRQTRSRRNAQCVGHQRSGSAAGISEESHNAASRAEASPGERRLHHRHRLYGQPGVSPQEPRAGPAGAHLHWPTHTHTHIKTLKSSFKLKIL